MIAAWFKKLQGRTSGFLLAFFVVGHVLAFAHQLTGTYIAFMSAFMGFVLGHSIKEDLNGKDDSAS